LVVRAGGEMFRFDLQTNTGSTCAPVSLMQLGILADIHGNSRALDAVLDDAKRRGIRQFVDLGDVLYGPMEPLRTFELLKTVDLIAGVSGNQDRFVRVTPMVKCGRKIRPSIFSSTISDRSRSNGSERCRQPQWSGAKIFLCHGSPLSDTTYLLEDVATGRPMVRPEAEIVRDLGDAARWPVILCGHTHVPRLIQLKNGPLILNPGSVGLPAYDDDLPVPHFHGDLLASRVVRDSREVRPWMDGFLPPRRLRLDRRSQSGSRTRPRRLGPGHRVRTDEIKRLRRFSLNTKRFVIGWFMELQPRQPTPNSRSYGSSGRVDRLLFVRLRRDGQVAQRRLHNGTQVHADHDGKRAPDAHRSPPGPHVRGHCSQEQTQRQLVRDLADRAFGGSPSSLVMQALAAKPASLAELAQIRTMLDEYEREGSRK